MSLDWRKFNIAMYTSKEQFKNVYLWIPNLRPYFIILVPAFSELLRICIKYVSSISPISVDVPYFWRTVDNPSKYCQGYPVKGQNRYEWVTIRYYQNTTSSIWRMMYFLYQSVSSVFAGFIAKISLKIKANNKFRKFECYYKILRITETCFRWKPNILSQE